MKFSAATVAAVAMATGAVAKPVITNANDLSPSEGKPFTVSLDGCDSGCTIYLVWGADQDHLFPIDTLSTDAKGDTKVTINNVGSGSYGIRVMDNSAPTTEQDSNKYNDFSPTFKYSGTGPTSWAPGMSVTSTASSSKATSTSDSDSTTTTSETKTTGTSSSASSDSSSSKTSASSSSTKATSSDNGVHPSSTKPPSSAGSLMKLAPLAIVGALAAALL